MSDASTARQPGSFNLAGLDLSARMVLRGEVALSLGIIAIIAVLLFPMPPVLLDLALGV